MAEGSRAASSRRPSTLCFAASQLQAPRCVYVASVSEAGLPVRTPLRDAAVKALGGGMAGGAAMVLNVGMLMWMRTIVNYQLRHGGGMRAAASHLYSEGGVRRFYRGVGPALLQAPLSRFGDTAANAGMLSLLEEYEVTRTAPVMFKTAAASVAAASFRVLLMPIDTFKTILQVEGAKGGALLRAKLAASGPRVLFAGAMGAASATLVGHYPWFLVYNSLNEYLPQYDRRTELATYLLRNASIGFCASAVSDTCSNSIRVLKVTKQSSAVAVTYPQALQMVLAKDGVHGLFFRGLQTKILANGIQGCLFSVLWRLGQDHIAARKS